MNYHRKLYRKYMDKMADVYSFVVVYLCGKNQCIAPNLL